jgi:hypothetical protein
LRGREHVLLLYGDGPAAEAAAAVPSLVRDLPPGRVTAYEVLADGASPAGALPGVAGDGAPPPVFRDARGDFAAAYAVDGPTAFAVRPDGCLGARLSPPTASGLAEFLGGVFAG